MPITTFERDQLAATPWKNGGGHTREIVRMPADSTMDSFDWRASVADMTADGPFSTFDGVQRVIVLLSGGGARLRSTDGVIDHPLDAPLVPFAFAGECAIDASLFAGASTDFNIMTRRATTRADVNIVMAEQALASCSAGVLFAVRGTWSVRATEDASSAWTLASHTGLWWVGESLAWQLTPTAEGDAIIAVSLKSVHRGRS